jgi:hypothetical protein
MQIAASLTHTLLHYAMLALTAFGVQSVAAATNTAHLLAKYEGCVYDGAVVCLEHQLTLLPGLVDRYGAVHTGVCWDD